MTTSLWIMDRAEYFSQIHFNLRVNPATPFFLLFSCFGGNRLSSSTGQCHKTSFTFGYVIQGLNSKRKTLICHLFFIIRMNLSFSASIFVVFLNNVLVFIVFSFSERQAVWCLLADSETIFYGKFELVFRFFLNCFEVVRVKS